MFTIHIYVGLLNFRPCAVVAYVVNNVKSYHQLLIRTNDKIKSGTGTLSPKCIVILAFGKNVHGKNATKKVSTVIMSSKKKRPW